MGYIKHDAIVMVTESHRPGGLPDIEAFRESLPPAFRALVIGPIEAVVNHFVSYVFLPDGSKEGWADSIAGDLYRAQFVKLFPSGADEGVTITFGADWAYDNPAPKVQYLVGGETTMAQLTSGPVGDASDVLLGIAQTVHNALTHAGLADTGVLLTVCTGRHPSATILKRGGDFTDDETNRLITGFGDPEAWTFTQHNHSTTGQPIATTSTTTPDGLQITIHHEPAENPEGPPHMTLGITTET